jgi:hypothetical protein
MPGRHARLLFLVALALSLSVHVMLLAYVPLPSHESGEYTREREFSVYLDPPPPPPDPPQDRIEEAPAPPPPEVALGLNAPLPESLNWLGFKDFIPQAAPLASTEQAAFTDQPVAAAPRESEAEPAPVPAPAVENTPPQPTDQQPPDQSPPMDAPPDDAPPDPAPSPNAAPRPDATPTPDPSPENVPPPDAPKEKPAPSEIPVEQAEENRTRPFASMFVDFIEQLVKPQANQPIEHETSKQQGDSPSATPAKDAADLETEAPPPSPNGAKPKPATSQPARPTAAPRSNKPVAPQPTPGASNQGIHSDKESQPTSVVEIPKENWSLGKPLAGKGLELKPRKPTFTLLTLMTAGPGNPLCELSFDAKGAVKRARIIKSSGDSRIDEGILNSLFYWARRGRGT